MDVKEDSRSVLQPGRRAAKGGGRSLQLRGFWAMLLVKKGDQRSSLEEAISARLRDLKKPGTVAFSLENFDLEQVSRINRRNFSKIFIWLFYHYSVDHKQKIYWLTAITFFSTVLFHADSDNNSFTHIHIFSDELTTRFSRFLSLFWTFSLLLLLYSN